MIATESASTPNDNPTTTTGTGAAIGVETMTVTVRDRSSEAPWGSGFTNPVTRKVTISVFCPRCGARRGEPYGQNTCDDGAFYWIERWDNPCGHVDHYADVLNEARQRASTPAGSAVSAESGAAGAADLVGDPGGSVR